MSGIYFASDGSYGPAAGLVVLDTTWWSDQDWDSVFMADDKDRCATALAVAKTKEG
jgi:hypothetical protein